MTTPNINISFKRKQSVGNSPSGLSYSPSSHTMPAIFQHRDSFVHQRELENKFCSDLVCCGIKVKDLHELLHHYEEHHHAPIEEEVDMKEVMKETVENNNLSTTNHPEDDIMLDDVDSPFPSPLPTQPHELAALTTNSPMLRKNNIYYPAISNTTLNHNATDSALSSPVAMSPVVTSPTMSQHTEEILNKALPALINQHPTPENLQLFKSEALYQTCDDGQDRPYKCPIRGCDKAYKNPNGLKYHQMHGHTEEESDAERDAQKPYVCTIGYCNKRYKNLNGLKYHIEHSHIAKLKQLPPGAIAATAGVNISNPSAPSPGLMSQTISQAQFNPNILSSPHPSSSTSSVPWQTHPAHQF
ncbi:hypothetical protein BDF20DRAFT_387455 [Mycotypha africana]|uniref:uncharacterized protein n=1 Tax=Mycotypha africana TaxID=64632 RepID=UPI00230166EC|nr:uncharacterized protein BDF20DRAFT_387455 [Mycotypha africana]KAI8984403.1 hypothetical protein BDF20DRAFT_387455 [Mycotypha africana]